MIGWFITSAAVGLVAGFLFGVVLERVTRDRPDE